jgi:flagellar biosynthesis protein FlhG
MRDFYASSATMPLDQADGLRRMFAGARPRHVIPMAANPYVPFGGVVIDRLTLALEAARCHTLVLDAADSAPPPNELAALDLAAAFEPLGPALTYFAARGLPLACVDTRGSAAGLIDAVLDAAPQADVVLVHAGASDLARLFHGRAARPLIVAADDPESVKHAYASIKLLALRCRLMTFDLLLAADPRSPRLPAIARSVAGCADGFIGSAMHAWAAVDPAAAPQDFPDAPMTALVAAQLCLDGAGTGAAWLPGTARPVAMAARPRAQELNPQEG